MGFAELMQGMNRCRAFCIGPIMRQTLNAPPYATSDTTFNALMNSLSRTCAFPVPVAGVKVHQTHISAVFVGGDLALKVKKPVKLPFLDFSSIQRRRFYCDEEIRINRSWAPGVYLGVIAVTQDADGARFQGAGPVVEWAVKMRRLSEADNLRSRLRAGTLTGSELIRVGQRIANIHQNASRYHGDQAAEAETDYRRRMRENWAFAQGLPAELIDPHVLQRLETLSGDWLQRHDHTLRQRADEGQIREVHGDLRLEHVYLMPDRTPPQDILIIDGIEFCSGLRRIDVVSDMAFLVMEMKFAGHRELAQVFTDAYFSETQDRTGRELLPLFAAYRSAVRGKVAAILSEETEVEPAEREKARARSCAHWLWSLAELEEPDRRPALILVSGLPGTGKSTLARGLAEITSIDEVLRSDVVRKELAASSGSPTAKRYSPQEIDRVYEECRTRAQACLLTGGRVIVDATFHSEAQRQSFIQLAIDCGVRCLWLEGTAPAEVTRQRLESRQGDASDADWSVWKMMQQQWEPASTFTERFHAPVDASGSAATTLNAAREALREQSLTA
jgi:uncharacterized protein